MDKRNQFNEIKFGKKKRISTFFLFANGDSMCKQSCTSSSFTLPKLHVLCYVSSWVKLITHPRHLTLNFTNKRSSFLTAPFILQTKHIHCHDVLYYRPWLKDLICFEKCWLISSYLCITYRWEYGENIRISLNLELSFLLDTL